MKEEKKDESKRYIPPHMKRRIAEEKKIEPPKPKSTPSSYWMGGTDSGSLKGDALFEKETVGNLFDKYDDIPVEITCEGDVPDPMESFASAAFPHILEENLRRMKYSKPTPIQKNAIPIAVEGRDIMACAQTGSGKTAAFLVPSIKKLLEEKKPILRKPEGIQYAYPLMEPRVLVLTPTRELAIQVHKDAARFSFESGLNTFCMYGGEKWGIQKSRLRRIRRVDILVATPGRLIDVLSMGNCHLMNVKTLILDEADRMLENGFEEQIRTILEEYFMPDSDVRQTLMFSATFPTQIQRLACDFMRDYVFITVGRVGSTSANITQHLLHIDGGEEEKKKHLVRLLKADIKSGGLVLIFVETKRGANSLERYLRDEYAFAVTSIHGDKEQHERQFAMHLFSSKKRPILVATDVAQRGLDIPNVTHVVNYDMPRAIQDYTHRIGRTGRVGHTGLATSFINPHEHGRLLRPLLNLMSEAKQDVPQWFTDMVSMYGSGPGGPRGRGPRGGRYGGKDFRKRGYHGGKSGGYDSTKRGGHKGGYEFGYR
eukprot:gnl/Carplike_NY0171/2478_a3330_501.p1 GENE.gnl/Carplike_NY0171/2478_a3330_501~~gnl/Carplike_NY0171/2478_a3330_501.p1  ORF type:complete len:541 (-),score=152.26 gnl/Carplike_NY0171/2478_a3330_501:58-1680(-)